MLKKPKTFTFNTISVGENYVVIATAAIMTYLNTVSIPKRPEINFEKVFGLTIRFQK